MIRRLLAGLLVIGACAAAIVMAGAKDESAKGKTVKMAFDNAFGLSEGGDLRVGGVTAGSTKTFEVSKGPECQGATPGDGPPRTCAVVDGLITKPGFKSFRADAHCDIRQQSLIGEYYVDCQPGTSSQELEDGKVIPVTRTTSTIPTDLVNNVMRRPYKERLRLILAELGTGLAGRPQDLSEVLRRAHPGLRETDKVLRILANQEQVLKNFITDSRIVVQQLDAKKSELARWVDEAGRTAEISASRRGDIARGFQRLPTFLDELRPTMASLGNLIDQQTPLLKDLQSSAPDLTEFFTRLGPFAEASRPAFRSLAKTSDAGKAAIKESSDEIAQLNALAKQAPEMAKPLRQMLVDWDDRGRAAEPDPRHVASAPPAPDKNRANARGKGFTAMEGLLNYFYWQTLAINEFDGVGHVLRTLLIENDCGAYRMNEPSAAVRKACNSYLGPYQPGVTDPDPTAGGARPQSTAKAAGEKQRGAGDPEAAPTPGKLDPSQPHVVLPPGMQDLLNQFQAQPSQGAPAAQPESGADAGQMLDFLLAP